MAEEITVGERRGSNVLALFLYPIPTPAQYGSTATNVVPTPADGLPDYASAVFSHAEKGALDAGESTFEIVKIGIEGMNNAEVLVRLQSLYATRKAAAAAVYLERYERVGARFDQS